MTHWASKQPPQIEGIFLQIAGYSTAVIRRGAGAYMDEIYRGPDPKRDDYFDRYLLVYSLSRFLFRVNPGSAETGAITVMRCNQPGLWPWEEKAGKLHLAFSGMWPCRLRCFPTRSGILIPCPNWGEGAPRTASLKRSERAIGFVWEALGGWAPAPLLMG